MFGTLLEIIGIALNPIGFVLEIVKDSVVPRNGAVVYCKLGPFEHTGIYIKNYRQILHLNRHGYIELVPPEEFAFHFGGTIYVSCHQSESIESSGAANRALARYESDSWKKYDIVSNNCHEFTVGCITGIRENNAFTFFMLEIEIRFATMHNNWRSWTIEDGNYLH